MKDLRAVWAGQVTADEILRPDRYSVRFPEELFPPRPRTRADYCAACARGYEAAQRTTIGVGVLLHNRVDLVDKLRARLDALAAVFGSARMYVLAGDSADGTETAVRTWCQDVPTVYRWVAPPESDLFGVQRLAVLRNALLMAMEADETPALAMMLDGDLGGPLSLDGVTAPFGAVVVSSVRDGLCQDGAAAGVSASFWQPSTSVIALATRAVER